MIEPQKLNLSGSNVQIGDVSQQRVYNVSQTGNAIGGDINVQQIAGDQMTLDGESTNLLEWLAGQQGVNRETALKKALATVAYIYDLTNQGGKILVQRKDNSVGEVILK
ncbi:MAG: hypothetical protein ACOYM4_13520 [Nodosilinea sp.]|jgi:hypothetical protein